MVMIPAETLRSMEQESLDRLAALRGDNARLTRDLATAREEVERLTRENGSAKCEIVRQVAENERLRAGYSAIMKATVEGRVCDDVAWFSTIETLYDYCDHMLHGDTPRAAEQDPDFSAGHAKGVRRS